MSKRKTEKLGIEKLPLEELKAERESVDFDKLLYRTMQQPLCENNGTEAYRQMAQRLKERGVTREQFYDAMDADLPNWRNSTEWKERIEFLVDLLFRRLL